MGQDISSSCRDDVLFGKASWPLSWLTVWYVKWQCFESS